MTTTRRDFLRLGAGGAALLLGARSGAESESGRAQTARAIHRATRNTRFGAAGTVLRRARGSLDTEKAYPGRPRLPLPTPRLDGERPLHAVALEYAVGSGFEAAPLELAAVSRLLLLTNGVTGQAGARLLRAAPSAGALYAGEVYLLAERIEGLAPGIYGYGVRRHELVRVREGRHLDALAGALAEPERVQGAAAALLLTNVFARYRVRYANRGYRYALIDSGHIGENARLAAAELGLADRAPLRWEDDALNALLDVDGRGEAVCAVHVLGRGAGSAPGGASGVAEGSTRSRPLAERQLRDPAFASTGLSATEAYHEATKLVGASAGGAPAVPTRPDPAAAIPDTDGAFAGGGSVSEAIRVRRSTRRFEAAPLSRMALERVLAVARANPALWHTQALELHIAAHRVGGLEPGLYRYAAPDRQLELLQPGALSEALVRACLGQRKSGTAAAAVVAVGRLAEAEAGGGARAYRDLLLDAGATAQRIYLAAEAAGLSARNLAAYYDDELDALLDLDGRTRSALHLTAVGKGD